MQRERVPGFVGRYLIRFETFRCLRKCQVEGTVWSLRLVNDRGGTWILDSV